MPWVIVHRHDLLPYSSSARFSVALAVVVPRKNSDTERQVFNSIYFVAARLCRNRETRTRVILSPSLRMTLRLGRSTRKLRQMCYPRTKQSAMGKFLPPAIVEALIFLNLSSPVTLAYFLRKEISASARWLQFRG